MRRGHRAFLPSFWGGGGLVWGGRLFVPGAWAFPGSPYLTTTSPLDMVHPALVYPYPGPSGLLTLFCGCLLSSLLPLSLPLAFVWLRKWKAHTGSAGPHLLEVLSLFFLWMLQQMARCRLMRAAAHLWARTQSAAGHVVPSYSHPQLGFTSWATERWGVGTLDTFA